MSASPKMLSESEDPLEDSRMTLGEHLEELKVRLIRSAIALLIAFVGSWAFHEQLGYVALQPLTRAVSWLNEDLVEIYEERLVADATLERSDFFRTNDPDDKRLEDPIRMPRGDSAMSGLIFYLKVCLYFGFFLSGSFILWQVWQFIAAGLYKKERGVVQKYFPASVGLFLGGIIFGYLMMVPYGQYFAARFSFEQIRFDPKLEEYFSFLKSLSLALGVVFQLPVFMFALGRLGLVEPSFFRKYRPHFILLILVLAAVLTPPDPFTQMMMAIPMWALYELGIVLAVIGHRKGSSSGSDPAPA